MSGAAAGWMFVGLVLSATLASYVYAVSALVRHARRVGDWAGLPLQQVSWGGSFAAAPSDITLTLKEVLGAAEHDRVGRLSELTMEVEAELYRGALIARQAPRICGFATCSACLLLWWDYRAVAWAVGGVGLCSTAMCVAVRKIAVRDAAAFKKRYRALIQRLSQSLNR